MRVGIVGYGWAGQAHASEFNVIEGVETTAVCSRRELDESELSARHGSKIRVFNDFEEMCRADIDLVSICTPHPFHAEQVEIAAKAGKNLVIEKPVAIDLKGVRRVEQAVQSSGVRAIVCFEAKVIGHFQTMREMIRQGLLGDIHYGESDYYHGIGPWYGQYRWNVKKDFGGSSLLTAGCHALDGLIWLMDSRPVQVFSYAARSSAPEFEPYEYPTTTSYSDAFREWSHRKSGFGNRCLPTLPVERLSDRLRRGDLERQVLHAQAGWPRPEGLEQNAIAQMIDSGDVADHPYQALFADFIDSVKEGTRSDVLIRGLDVSRTASVWRLIAQLKRGGRCSWRKWNEPVPGSPIFLTRGSWIRAHDELHYPHFLAGSSQVSIAVVAHSRHC